VQQSRPLKIRTRHDHATRIVCGALALALSLLFLRIATLI
jgi:hypothetical protein